METSKKCSKCGEVKLLECFPQRAALKSGRDSWCKACRAAATSRRRAENVDEARARMARWRAENREKERDYSARYRAEHAEKVRECNSRCYKANIGEARARNARWRAKNAEKVRSRSREQTVGLHDSYLANLMGLPVATVKPEVLELKRATLQAKRKIREIQRHFKESK